MGPKRLQAVDQSSANLTGKALRGVIMPEVVEAMFENDIMRGFLRSRLLVSPSWLTIDRISSSTDVGEAGG